MQGRKAGKKEYALVDCSDPASWELLESRPQTNKRNERFRRKADPVRATVITTKSWDQLLRA
jgi:hypothetical protein